MLVGFRRGGCRGFGGMGWGFKREGFWGFWGFVNE